jgi:carboxymethylenebutenolidase
MELRSERIEIASGGGRMPAYLTRPRAGGPRSAVIVLMEAFGLVPNLQKEADRIARMGYVAIAPDVYHRQAPDNLASYDDLPKAVGMMRKLDDAEFLADMRATLGYLRSTPEVGAAPIGVTGFCMGGRLSFLAACALPGEIRASSPFYGGGMGALLDRAGEIRCPLHLFFGKLDFFIPEEEVRRIDEKLRALGLDYAIDHYEGAVHGFCCEERRESYHAAAAQDAWAKLEAFFAKHLVRA